MLKIFKQFDTIRELKRDLERADERNKELKRNFQDAQEIKDNYYKQWQKEKKELQSDFASEKRIYTNEIQLVINEKVSAEKEINAKLSSANAVLTKEVEILNKAFENMGFDVKDMKGILDTLVKGIVSGNKVNIIK